MEEMEEMENIILELNQAERLSVLNAIIAYTGILEAKGTEALALSVEALVLRGVAKRIGELISQKIVVKALKKERETELKEDL